MSDTPQQATPAKASSLVEIRGQLESVTYTNEESGYTIAKIKVYDRRELVTVVGNIMNPTSCEVMRLRGNGSTIPSSANSSRLFIVPLWEG